MVYVCMTEVTPFMNKLINIIHNHVHRCVYYQIDHYFRILYLMLMSLLPRLRLIQGAGIGS